MRTNLKDAFSGLITQDVDFVLTISDGYFIVEEKLLSTARTGPAQAVIYKMLDDILSHDHKFLGCHKVVVDSSNKVFLDERIGISFNSFLFDPNCCYRNQYNQTWFDKILYFKSKYLWDGKGIPPTRKTEKEHTFIRDSKLEPELAKRGIKKSRIDWVFVNYVSGYFCLLFENDNYRTDPTIQRIIDVLKTETPNARAYNPKTKTKYKFCGAYRIKYDKETLELYKKDKRLQEKNLLKGKNPSNVWEISRLNSNSKERVGHVTQKPEAIMRRIIKSMSAERDIVLDAFAGSTVAAKVCIEENRNSISCDIDPKSTDYFQTQLSRIKHSHDYIVTNNLEDLFGQLRRN